LGENYLLKSRNFVEPDIGLILGWVNQARYERFTKDIGYFGNNHPIKSKYCRE